MPLGTPFTNMVQLKFQHVKFITSIIKHGAKLLIHSQTLLKFGNWQVISSHTLLDMWLLISTGIKSNLVNKRGPWQNSREQGVLEYLYFTLFRSTNLRACPRDIVKVPVIRSRDINNIVPVFWSAYILSDENIGDLRNCFFINRL